MLVGGETNRGHPPRSPIASAVLRELSKDERWKPSLNRLMEGLWQLKSQQEGEELFEECLRMHLEQRRVAVGGGSTQPPPSSDYPSPEPPYVRYLICDSIVLLQRPLTQHATTRTASHSQCARGHPPSHHGQSDRRRAGTRRSSSSHPTLALLFPLVSI